MAWPGARREYPPSSTSCARPLPTSTFPITPSGIGRFHIGISGIGVAAQWGYVQAINRWDVPAPILAAHDPTVANFVVGTPLLPGVLGTALGVS